jgi:Ca-activated chloride channel family protein
VLATALAALTAVSLAAQDEPAAQDGARFKSGVELVNVTAPVSDETGRFVSGLTKDDFAVYDNGAPQTISQFSNERMPVSLGILLDVSGSMTPDKMASARAAITRLIDRLLAPDDELFFGTFSDRPRILQRWTTSREAIRAAVDDASAFGGTALYDAIADALPLASAGRHQKKAILVISDGNDTDSRISVGELRQAIRESEVLVYALGVDGTDSDRNRIQIQRPRPVPPPVRIPFPPFGRPGGRGFPQIFGGAPRYPKNVDERVNADALRQVTDDTGGRTEIVRGFGDLDEATTRIADELSKQYYLGYAPSGERDGQWHSIRVEVKGHRYTVRARRGYIAS